MRAIEFTRERAARVVDMEIPVPGQGEVLVRITSAGICGSDLTALGGKHPFRVPPLISGHEGGGIVESVHDSVSADWVGARVAVEPQQACRTCTSCKLGIYNLCRNRLMLGMQNWPGTLAEYIVAPEECLHRVSNTVPIELLALAEPLAVAHHAVCKVPSVTGKRVAVLGGGAIGGLIVHFLAERRAESIVVTDVRPHNRQLGLELGATAAVDPLTSGWKDAAAGYAAAGEFDIVFVAAAVPHIVDDAIELLAPQGIVVQVGLFSRSIDFDIAAMQQYEKLIVGSNIYTAFDFVAAVETLENNVEKLQRLVTSQTSLEAAADFLTNKALGRVDEIVKMIVVP
ncbi:hypothetical protein E3T39_00975 [Cryobacterium suzukii]|uniref:Zn-dependent alcohol dehydrogenase n=1 Tax=Cryobacterium suzukii TaxID=1259198 RepID=A0A4R9AJJ7_9MICO|nr:alcohol dehydrogenase catalytic domain-containing protein [Cryobacterium suzukii]TFD62556.1 hypothetical protein E3T39_00975 [Cryobacterium suzukii]